MKKKILFTLSILFGLLLINAGLDKFFHYMPMPANISPKLLKAFGAFMEIGWLMPLVGIAEIMGGVLFAFPKARALGAIVVFPVMIGILLTNSVTDTTGLPIALVLAAINFWVIIENRKKYLTLIK